MTTDALIYDGARWQSLVDGPAVSAHIDTRQPTWQQTYVGSTSHKLVGSSILQIGSGSGRSHPGALGVALQQNDYVLSRYGYMLDVAISPVWAKFKFLNKAFPGIPGTFSVRPVYTDDEAVPPDTFPADLSVAPVRVSAHGVSGENTVMFPPSWTAGFADGKYNTLQMGPSEFSAQDNMELDPASGALTVEMPASAAAYAPEFGVRGPAGWEQIDGLTSATAQIWDGSAWWPS